MPPASGRRHLCHVRAPYVTLSQRTLTARSMLRLAGMEQRDPLTEQIIGCAIEVHVGEYRPDLVIEGQVVVEFQPHRLERRHQALHSLMRREDVGDSGRRGHRVELSLAVHADWRWSRHTLGATDSERAGASSLSPLEHMSPLQLSRRRAPKLFRPSNHRAPVGGSGVRPGYRMRTVEIGARMWRSEN